MSRSRGWWTGTGDGAGARRNFCHSSNIIIKVSTSICQVGKRCHKSRLAGQPLQLRVRVRLRLRQRLGQVANATCRVLPPLLPLASYLLSPLVVVVVVVGVLISVPLAFMLKRLMSSLNRGYLCASLSPLHCPPPPPTHTLR